MHIKNSEVTVFCKYLLGSFPDELTVQLYNKAINTAPNNVSASDERIINFALKNKWSIPFLDGGAALIKPHCTLRKRLYTLLAILECNPKYTNHFLVNDRSPFYLLSVCYSAARAATVALVGIMIIKIIS